MESHATWNSDNSYFKQYKEILVLTEPTVPVVHSEPYSAGQ